MTHSTNGRSASPLRLTFRDPAGGVAWQKQLRDRHLAEGTPPVPHLEVKQAVVRPVSRKLAEQIILKYEWLGTMSGTGIHFGLFFGPYCAGVTCIVTNGAFGAGVHHHRQFGIERKDLLTLARGACVHWAPVGCNSKLVSWTCKLLSKTHVGKLIVAYSDTDAGEIGTIYQACNWVYIGQTAAQRPDYSVVSPQGRVYNHASWAVWLTKTESIPRK